VARTPQPSETCASRESSFGRGNCERNQGVPLRSEKRFLQVRQYSKRSRWLLPNHPETVKVPAFRRPYFAQAGF
jgi:hypothetical protein